MQFVKYYSNLLAAKGQPQLSCDEHRRLFNIVSLENRIDELYKMDKFIGDQHRRDYFYRKQALEKQLHELTKLEHPANVFIDMVKKSKQ